MPSSTPGAPKPSSSSWISTGDGPADARRGPAPASGRRLIDGGLVPPDHDEPGVLVFAGAADDGHFRLQRLPGLLDQLAGGEKPDLRIALAAQFNFNFPFRIQPDPGLHARLHTKRLAADLPIVFPAEFRAQPAAQLRTDGLPGGFLNVAIGGPDELSVEDHGLALGAARRTDSKAHQQGEDGLHRNA